MRFIDDSFLVVSRVKSYSLVSNFRSRWPRTALGQTYMRSAPSLRSLHKAALDTVPLLVWFERSDVLRVECLQLSFFTPLSFTSQPGLPSPRDRLVGLVVRRPPRERKIPGSNPACAGIFSGSSHTSD